jgi:hypothetical protein
VVLRGPEIGSSRTGPCSDWLWIRSDLLFLMALVTWHQRQL